uniref:Uncharacterized protein n=1 Tax=Timema monikensis TaxID=170555 RepID=A0A7R9E938_9NEOP|nr:unnamed protein product [Timema monikensis]
MVVVVPVSSGEMRNLAQSWQLFACGLCSRMFVTRVHVSNASTYKAVLTLGLPIINENYNGYSSPMASLVMTDSSQPTSECQHLDNEAKLSSQKKIEALEALCASHELKRCNPIRAMRPYWIVTKGRFFLNFSSNPRPFSPYFILVHRKGGIITGDEANILKKGTSLSSD